MGFYGLEIAKSGLYASQTALDVIGQNVANSATEGYTRQRIDTASIEPAALYVRYAKSAKYSVGGGVEIQSIQQIRDAYLDRQLRQENANLGKWEAMTDATSYVQSLFDESSAYSISSVLSKFYDSMSDLSTNPESQEIRTTVQQNAIELSDVLNQTYSQLTDYQDQQNENMFTTVQDINAKLKGIADYNAQIHAYELSGESANDLRDKRNLLLDSLSKLIDVDYAENAQGEVQVSCEGQVLVDNTTVTELNAVADQTGVVSGTAGYYSIYYGDSTTEFQYSSGELAGYREMRDGNSVDEVGIPRLLDRLNTLCQSIAKSFNDINASGYTMATSSTASKTGVNFFDVPTGGYSAITAGNFSLSQDILDDVNNIAASSQLIDLSASNTNEGNNENILKMVALCSSNDIDGVGNFESYYSSALTELAINCQSYKNMYDSQSSIIDNLETQREAVSGVSINDEMINMVKYQHAYAAASRLITAMDEMLDTLINTGVVGR